MTASLSVKPAPELGSGRGAVIRGAIVAALGGFLLGFDTVVISGANDALQEVFTLDSFWLGFTVAVAMIGTIAGAVVIGKPADVYGRKAALSGLAVAYFVSAVGCGLAWSWEGFLVARFIGGLAIGGASVVSPMYIAEISPGHLRGRLVTVGRLNLVIGILVCYGHGRGLRRHRVRPFRGDDGAAVRLHLEDHAGDQRRRSGRYREAAGQGA